MRFSKEESGQDRREFLTWAGVCASQWVVLNTFGPRIALAEGGRKVAAEEPWARIEELDKGIWAVVSTPLAARDFTTICNGGIIAGDDRVLVVESFGSPAGAKWVADQTEKLTGHRPTDVVITHFHGDHWDKDLFEKTDYALMAPPGVLDQVESYETGEPGDRHVGEAEIACQRDRSRLDAERDLPFDLQCCDVDHRDQVVPHRGHEDLAAIR